METAIIILILAIAFLIILTGIVTVLFFGWFTKQWNSMNDSFERRGFGGTSF
jgi:hypothetical protein